ncbi:hypothetical protein ACFWMT_23075 [Streptomyces sp. NPDC058368]|uniref:hypothetical protein n=1 Tax=Streptomyces sp. NPDC058368 TaxID=3346461 RepID=UPI003667C162
MRHTKAWYAPAHAGVYRMTTADHGTSGSRVTRTTSHTRALGAATRTAPTGRLLPGAAW